MSTEFADIRRSQHILLSDIESNEFADPYEFDDFHSFFEFDNFLARIVIHEPILQLTEVNKIQINWLHMILILFYIVRIWEEYIFCVDNFTTHNNSAIDTEDALKRNTTWLIDLFCWLDHFHHM